MGLVQKIRILFLLLILVAVMALVLQRVKLFRGNKKFSRPQKLNPHNDYYERSVDEMLRSIKQKPIIFVGGYARSGTTLMRAILDSHPMIRCGPESKILPQFLSFIASWKSNEYFVSQLKDASINMTAFFDATLLFVHHMIALAGPYAPRLCLKDPLILEHIDLLSFLLPNAQFIFMVRDPRASIVSLSQVLENRRQLDENRFLSSLKDWNSVMTRVDAQCTRAGVARCWRVKYEHLVLRPNATLRHLVDKFLRLPWSNEMLRHEKHVGGRVKISRSEWSSDQIAKPIHNASLYKWHDFARKLSNVTLNVIEHMAPMFKKFGYDINEKTYVWISNAQQISQIAFEILFLYFFIVVAAYIILINSPNILYILISVTI